MLKSLLELTQQESGILVFNGKEVLVTNWSDCPPDHLPLLDPFGFGTIPWKYENLTFVEQYNVDDIRSVLPGSIHIKADGSITTDMEIIYDFNGNIPALWGYGAENETVEPTSGIVYKLQDGDDEIIVIAPKDWC